MTSLQGIGGYYKNCVAISKPVARVPERASGCRDGTVAQTHQPSPGEGEASSYKAVRGAVDAGRGRSSRLSVRTGI